MSIEMGSSIMKYRMLFCLLVLAIGGAACGNDGGSSDSVATSDNLNSSSDSDNGTDTAHFGDSDSSFGLDSASDSSIGPDSDSDTFSIEARAKPRVIVMSDIGGSEPDDQESFVRLLLYSNEIDIVGLIGSNSQFGHDRGDIEVFKDIIDVYDTVRSNLLVHADGYPTAESLTVTAQTGQRELYGMDGVGEGHSTDGSNHIFAELTNDDTRPLWVLGWGGTNSLAQALWDLQHDSAYTEEERISFIKKLRVYDVAGQDDSGAWIAHTFYPHIFYIRTAAQFLSFTKRSDVYPKGEEAQGDLSMVNGSWFGTNIMTNHGAYGETYPGAVYMWEGDTPSFLYLVQNGLGAPEHPSFGSWGGRFTETLDPAAGRYSGNDDAQYLTEHGAPMHVDAKDSFYFEPDDVTYTTRYTPLWRWRDAYQNDFAARMDWTTTGDFSAANHPPSVVVEGHDGKGIVETTVQPGSQVVISAQGTDDPDGDTLAYHWWVYAEAGTCKESISLENDNSRNVTVSVPVTANIGETVHVVLTARDDGEPALSAYRRVVLTVAP